MVDNGTRSRYNDTSKQRTPEYSEDDLGLKGGGVEKACSYDVRLEVHGENLDTFLIIYGTVQQRKKQLTG